MLIKIYAGKDIEVVSGSKIKAVVLQLMNPYLNRGHHLYMDNYYNSVDLSHTLLEFKLVLYVSIEIQAQSV